MITFLGGLPSSALFYRIERQNGSLNFGNCRRPAQP